MGDTFSTPSQPNSSSSPTTAASTSASANPTMSSTNPSQSIPPEPTQHPGNEELETPNPNPPTDTKTDGVLINPSETDTPSVKDAEESKSPIQETLSEKDLVESIKDGEGGGDEGKEQEEDEEEEGECGFCLFMKGGGCKDTFTDWENCVEEAEKKQEDIVEKCFQATAALKKCMEAHSDYYAPLLQAEKAAEEEAAKQLEEEKERSNHGEQSTKKENEETLGGSDEMKQS